MKYFFLTITLLSVSFSQSFQSVIEKLRSVPAEKRQSIIEPYLNTKKVAPIIDNDTTVTFVLYGMAKSVAVNGNLQQWMQEVPLDSLHCGPYTLFYKTFTAPADARLDYQLVIDGKYRTDPQNPHITPSGFGPHSELRMPKFIPSPFRARRDSVPRGTMDSLAPTLTVMPPLSHYMIAPRPLLVYRPAGYDMLTGLPVIYIHDGLEAAAYMEIPAMLDNMIHERLLPPMLAVFIPPVHRETEYMGSMMPKYADYLALEVVPLIDHLYRTDRYRASRAMAGISAGGTITVESVLRHPEVFANAGIQSGSITTATYERTRARCITGTFPQNTRIYMDCGKYDIPFTNAEFGNKSFLTLHQEYDALLTQYRIPHYFKVVNDGHEWASWRERFPDMLMYFFGGRR